MKNILHQIFCLLILISIGGCDSSNNNHVENTEKSADDVHKINNLQKLNVDTEIQFEKIIFHTTGCEGTCPTYHLSVDNEKKIELYSEIVYSDFNYKRDKNKIGYFKGVVADTTYNKLIKELETVGLDTMNFGENKGYDAPRKTIIVYYNGKRKYFQAMFHSKSANKLVETLYEICATSKTRRVNEKLLIENASR